MTSLDKLHLNVNDPLRAGGHADVNRLRGGHFRDPNCNSVRISIDQ